MRPLITPKHYYDPDIYSIEQERLLRGQWQFAAFAHDLTAENDFVSVEIGGKAVFVQRLEGELRAFENVCSHRFSRLHACGKGNARIRCPYHGWMYDAEGLPCAIPHRPKFDDLTPEVIKSLRLPAWQVEQCGNLVFLRDDRGGSNLRDFLGSNYEELEQLSLAFGPLLDRNEIIINANWKIIVENTLEVYHVDFVHSDTFKRLGTSSDSNTVTFAPPHSRYVSPLGEKAQAECRPVKPLFGSRPFATDGYMHHLIFPNATVATTYGMSFSFQHIEPLGPNATRFTSYVFQSKLETPVTGAKAMMLEAFNSAVVNFNRKVFEEDRVVCEGVQQGAHQTRGLGMLSDEESRIVEFQRMYATAINEVDDPAAIVEFRKPVHSTDRPSTTRNCGTGSMR